MTVGRIRILVPMAYAAVVLLCVFFWDDALVPVASIGGVLVGMAYIFLRPEPGLGRARDRNRNRNRG